MTVPKLLMTYADYAALPDDGRRYELYEGEIEMTPAPSTRHQLAIKNLLFLLEGYLRAHGAGVIIPSPVDLILSNTTVLQPDLVVVLRGREQIITERGVEGPPNLVIEVLSPSTAARDRQSKAQLYARYGVKHYWIADPDARRIESYELDSGAYALRRSVDQAGALETDLFPGLRIPGAAIWE
jgi:Uma2 family endonuclease